MTELYHAVIKDHDNSGYVWDAFFCKDCLNSLIMKHEYGEVLRRNMATPKYLSRLYLPLVDEPNCSECGNFTS
ncbi:MAG: hypothetical protein R6V46_17835 [Desulfatiglandaceae bacterium]